MLELLADISPQRHLLSPVIFVAMLAVGMELRVGQFRELFATPRLPIAGTLIHTMTFPLLAVAAVLLVQLAGIELAGATIIGVLLIAACPSGGFSNILTMIAGANLPLSITLTVVSSVLSFVTVPLLLGGFGLLVQELSGPVDLPMGEILYQLATLVLLPVVIGMWMTAKIGWLTQERVKFYQTLTQLLLYLTIALLIAESWDMMTARFLDALPWSVCLCAGNLIVCFYVSRTAGLRTEDAITVALEGSIRNLGIAFLIAANTLGRLDIAVLPTIYFLTVLVISILFAKNWRRIPGIGYTRSPSS